MKATKAGLFLMLAASAIVLSAGAGNSYATFEEGVALNPGDYYDFDSRSAASSSNTDVDILLQTNLEVQGQNGALLTQVTTTASSTDCYKEYLNNVANYKSSIGAGGGYICVRTGATPILYVRVQVTDESEDAGTTQFAFRDNDAPAGSQRLCADNDGDGYGATGTNLVACSGSTTIEDCDDDFAASYPGGTEVCDNRDNDCDSIKDDSYNDIAGSICQTIEHCGAYLRQPCGVGVSAPPTGTEYYCHVPADQTEAPNCRRRCTTGYSNCDSDLSNGCEDVFTDVSNCGSCKNVCSSENVQASSCVDGKCQLVCNVGYSDCDSDSYNGCETSTGLDVSNCGSCGVVCSSPNTQASCGAGECEFNCNENFYDINRQATVRGADADGCEYFCGITNSGEEILDGLDNDCDGTLLPDETDNDHDGFAEYQRDCDDDSTDDAAQYADVTINIDPDGDGDVAEHRNPDAVENVLDGIDNNCDGEIDERVVCGDGRIASDVGEVCDEGSAALSAFSDSATCDGSAAMDADGNTQGCTLPACGDKYVNEAAGEQCDDGANGDNTDGCTDSCELVVCGDSRIDAGAEACDDGNDAGGDGCSATCQVESSYECTGKPSVCTTSCGNGVVSFGTESCDDSNRNGGDGCSPSCQTERNYYCRNTPSTCIKAIKVGENADFDEDGVDDMKYTSATKNADGTVTMAVDALNGAGIVFGVNSGAYCPLVSGYRASGTYTAGDYYTKFHCFKTGTAGATAYYYLKWSQGSYLSDWALQCSDGDGDGYGLAGTNLGACRDSAAIADCDDDNGLYGESCPLPCAGIGLVSLTPDHGSAGTPADALTSGQGNCAGKTVVISSDSACSDNLGSCQITEPISGAGCTATFNAQATSTSYYACLDRDSDGRYTTSGEVSGGKAFTVTEECSGDIGVALNPGSTSQGTPVTVTATASGLINCDGKTVNINTQEDCAGQSVSTCAVSGDGCDATFTSPDSTTTYYACIRKGDTPFSASPGATFTVGGTCSGSIDFALVPSQAQHGDSMSARISGLADCEGKPTRVFDGNCFTGVEVASCIVSAAGSGCSTTFSAPAETKSYSACIDKNDDGSYAGGGEESNIQLLTITSTPAKCEENYDNCDLDLGDGCEYLLSDAQNCGYCGHDCSAEFVHAQSTCVSGACQFVRCEAGYYDVGGEQGCECQKTETSEGTCFGGTDEDCDGQTDCYDSDCVNDQACTVPDTSAPTVTVSHSPASPSRDGTVTITATAEDSESDILSFVLFADGVKVEECASSPCSIAGMYGVGSHTYSGKATSAGGTGRSGTQTFDVPACTSSADCSVLNGQATCTTGQCVIAGCDADSELCGTECYKARSGDSCSGNAWDCADGYSLNSNTNACEPVACTDGDWYCTGWAACTPPDMQTRTCTHSNFCATDDAKPPIERGCGTECGDGALAAGEGCDDSNTNSNDGCSVACVVESGYSCAGTPSVCVPVCGDGILARGEACDKGNPGASPPIDVNLGGNTCATVGNFAEGTLACNAVCSGFDTSDCVAAPSGCVTSADCTAPEHGTAACVNGMCTAICDDDYELQGDVCVPRQVECITNADCVTPAHGIATCSSGSCVTTCDDDYELQNGVCVLKEIECTKTPGQETKETTCDDDLDNDCDRNKDTADSDCRPVAACGNSALDTGEECDGTSLADKTCATYKVGSKFTGGILECNPACKFDVSDCFVEEIKSFAGVAWEAGHEEVGELEIGSAVSEYRIKIKARTESPSLTFRTLESKPATAPDISNVFRFIQIETNMPESVIESVRLKFAVDKSWILDNGLDKEKIKLSRLEEGSWKRYDTSIVSPVGDAIMYEAVLPGLSIFAIEGEKISAPPARQPEPTAQPTGGGGGGGFGTRAAYTGGGGGAFRQTIAAPVKGNGICEAGESQATACVDCGCASSYSCVNDQCIFQGEISRTQAAGEELPAGDEYPSALEQGAPRLLIPAGIWLVLAFVSVGLLTFAFYKYYLKPRYELPAIAEQHRLGAVGEDIQKAKDFISHALSEGHNVFDIKNHLLQIGWSHESTQQAVDENAQDLSNLSGLAELHEIHVQPAAAKKLRAYVKAGVAKGYSKSQIRTIVLSSRWPEDVVEKVLAES